MVNSRLRKFSPFVDKTAKNRRYCSGQSLAHTLPKGQRLKQVGIEKGSVGMKKGLVAIFCLLVLTFSSLPVAAQTRYRRYDTVRRYEQRSSDWRYRDSRRWDRDRSFWDRHRDKLTTGIGAGGGAVLGAAVGGKKGAVIGALLGAGGAALYTYKLRDRNRRYRRY
jgi:hypothetical protein